LGTAAALDASLVEGVVDCEQPARSSTATAIAHKAVSQLLWPDKDREEWFSFGENHEKTLGFGLNQLRNRFTAHCLNRALIGILQLPPFLVGSAGEGAGRFDRSAALAE
jgi:hypothetical protein